MICVSIGRARHKHTIAEHKHLVEQGFPLVELRLDYIRTDVDLPRLLKDKPGPVIVTCRRPEDGGMWRRGEEARLMTLRTAIVSGAEYVDLEEDVAATIPRFGDTKRIVSMHDFEGTPDNLEEIHARLAKLDPDVIKICTMANSPQDVLRMFQMLEKVKGTIPTIGLCMGDIGTPTRILAGKFGSPWTYTSFSKERQLAPGLIHCKEMRELYRYNSIDEDTEAFAVIADPVGHSLSPLIHNSAFARLDMNRVYFPMRLPQEDVDWFMENAPELGIKGVSVTIPHKESVIKKLTQAEQAVMQIGACNTVFFDGMERIGYNTDYRAAILSINNELGNTRKETNMLAGTTALVLGAGGVGKAIAWGLMQQDVNVILTDIDADRALALSERLECEYCEWRLRGSIRCDMLINCTPVGMHPNVDESPFEKKDMHTHMLVFDAVYNPENTLFIKDARDRGCRIVTGVDMFVLQAALQFRLFTAQSAPGQLMRQVIKRETSAAKY
jgi:3-dehydroquinate dehydratase / shikimate dehydrogenase